MRIAVISNIQANLNALEAVLQAIDTRHENVERIVSAGDVIGRGPHPNEVIDLLRQREIESVRGNYDDAVGHGVLESGTDFADRADEEIDALALRWTAHSLTPENMEFVRNLPGDMRIMRSGLGTKVARNTGDERTSEYRRNFLMRSLFGGLAREGKSVTQRVLVLHGSPRAQNEFIRGGTAQSILKVVAREAQTDLMVTGHSGESFHRQVDGVTFVGAGVVDNWRDGAGVANYAIVDVTREITAQFADAEYDLSAHIRDIENSGLPDALARRYRRH